MNVVYLSLLLGNKIFNFLFVGCREKKLKSRVKKRDSQL